MKGVQCYELFGGIALKNHAFFHLIFHFHLQKKKLPKQQDISAQLLLFFITFWSIGCNIGVAFGDRN